MSQNINLSNAEINKDYVVTEIKSNKERLKHLSAQFGNLTFKIKPKK